MLVSERARAAQRSEQPSLEQLGRFRDDADVWLGCAPAHGAIPVALSAGLARNRRTPSLPRPLSAPKIARQTVGVRRAAYLFAVPCFGGATALDLRCAQDARVTRETVEIVCARAMQVDFATAWSGAAAERRIFRGPAHATGRARSLVPARVWRRRPLRDGNVVTRARTGGSVSSGSRGDRAGRRVIAARRDRCCANTEDPDPPDHVHLGRSTWRLLQYSTSKVALARPGKSQLDASARPLEPRDDAIK
jgi:hypothetical protein